MKVSHSLAGRGHSSGRSRQPAGGLAGSGQARCLLVLGGVLAIWHACPAVAGERANNEGAVRSAPAEKALLVKGPASGGAGKVHEFGVKEPDGYRMEHYRAPVPETLKGARVVDVTEAEELWRGGKAVFLDVYPQAPKPPGLPKSTVWRTPKHESIKGAHWLANIGYGRISGDMRDFMVREIARLTGGDKTRTLVFFCLRDCWMSWNAAKRAIEMGHSDVVWFPDGTDGWRDFDLPTQMLTPLPMS